MNLILCGLPMSGKTTLGKLLAEELDWIFIDTDQLLEKAYTAQTGRQYTCREIFREEGEEQFRKLEKAQIAALKGTQHSIIAVGGGSLGDPENIAILQDLGRIIYLKMPPNVLWERVNFRGMPAYLDQENPEKAFYALAKKRMPLYEAAANETIEINHLSTQEAVALLSSLIKGNRNGK